MPVLFPAAPTNGQIFESGNLRYIYDGVSWESAGTTPIAASIPQYLLASLPTASSAGAGAVALITNVGPTGIFVRSTGSLWIPDGRQVLGRANTTSSHTGNTTETALFTVTVPAGLLHANAQLILTVYFGATSNANTKTFRIRLGGLAGTALTSFTFTTNSLSNELIRRIVFKNSLSSQETYNSVSGSFGPVVGAVATAAVNFANAQDIVVSLQLATGTDTANVYSALLEWVA